MKTELANYCVSPKIIRSGVPTEVTIKPLGAHAAFAEDWYSIQMIPMTASREPAYDYDVQKVSVGDGGSLSFQYVFNGEQEYIIRLFKPTDVKFKPGKAFLNLHVYVLYGDLYERKPYRGDFHAHSCCSDGGEAPEITAANYRKKGFDFYALTDHHKYWPSIQCMDYYRDKPVDFITFPGEEVHSPGNFIHIVSFGGNTSVNEIFEKDPVKYDEEVREILRVLDLPEEANGYAFAACLWVFRKIKETGGLSIFAHPHWMADAYHVPDALTDMIFKSREFDAFELLGGHENHSNNLQVAFYNDERAKGNTFPVVGSSDAHGTFDGAYWFTWSSTIVFSADLETISVKEAVKDMYAVAVESWPNEQIRVHGSYRMVSYARFLLDEYFPVHDELCFEEGRLMREMFLGGIKAHDILAMMKGRTDQLLDRYWGEM